VNADLVLVGGHVFAGGVSAPGAVAVHNGQIVAVGNARGLTGPRTVVLDVAGGLVVPGFVDAHVHPVLAGLQSRRCDLTAAASRDGCLALVAAYAVGSEGWILGGGWSAGLFPGGQPDRADLDRVAPGRPVYLLDGDQHNAWASGAALALAGIGPGTPDPPGGRIARDAAGVPTGCLHERAADLVAAAVPAPTAAELRAALRAAVTTLRRLGVTGWQDALVGPYLGCPDPLGTYLAAAADGELDWRATGALWWDRDRGPEQVADLAERRAAGAAVGLRLTHVKIMLDGILENRTAAMTSPYADATHAGDTALTPPELAAAVIALERHGFAAHVHAVGDRAVRDTLDAVAAARAANGPAPFRLTGCDAAGHGPARGAAPRGPARDGLAPRGPALAHQIAHAQVIDPADLPRFAALGVTATIQPLWAAAVPQMAELIGPGLGPRRYTWQYPFRSLRAAGARLAAGSDWPVSSPDPLHGIHTAVTRRPATRSAPWLDPARAYPDFLPHQAISAAAALTAYTAGAAHAAGLADRCGTLAPGYAADLAVLDTDITRCPPDAIQDATVILTLLAGRIVHDGRAPAAIPTR
jgi:predicted amidohydrolase YtcJ